MLQHLWTAESREVAAKRTVTAAVGNLMSWWPGAAPAADAAALGGHGGRWKRMKWGAAGRKNEKRAENAGPPSSQRQIDPLVRALFSPMSRQLYKFDSALSEGAHPRSGHAFYPVARLCNGCAPPRLPISFLLSSFSPQ